MSHSFHIPVMGTGFTIDTPLKVARYGISSVMSVDDNLMEKIREYYCRLWDEPFEPIAKNEPDSRARRITAYLNFVGRAVQKQVEDLKASAFTSGTEITKYFELLDDGSLLKRQYERMRSLEPGEEKASLEDFLRANVTAGSIDINILTKLDREAYKDGQKLPREYSDALSALRGFAKSQLSSSVVFSAGLNPILYSYVENFEDFFENRCGLIKKKIILKVSDFRSAHIQGKIFAKKGIWVSEYRIESGLNCGGHVFPTDGYLLGPILEEFKQKKESLIQELFGLYRQAMAVKKNTQVSVPPVLRITAQGGIGTRAEDKFLLRYYKLDGTGWGTPFLLVPEVTSVDRETLGKLATANENTVYLSDASPLGVPIYNLVDSPSEKARLKRIQEGHPGSPCLNQYMSFNTEFTEVPICTASSQYQARKITELKEKGLDAETYEAEFKKIVRKACVCHDLGDGALAKYNLKYKGFEPVPAVCPGPNLVYFSGLFTFKEMVDHIYGRLNLLNEKKPRPHVFINELKLYLQYLRGKLTKAVSEKEKEAVAEFKRNLADGIAYYKNLAAEFLEETEEARMDFQHHLSLLRDELEALEFAISR